MDADELADRLDAIAEEIADLAIAQLQAVMYEDDQAVARAGAARERRLTRARKAVEKAVELLRSDADVG